MREEPSAKPLYAVYLAAAFVALLVVYFWLAPDRGGPPRPESYGEFAVLPPKAVPTLAPALRSPQGAGRTRIGVIAGHSGFDSGAVCDDGLTEVSINETIADLVAAQLTANGIAADVLEEFDPRLDGYVATALVSVHADSCIYPEATGFKVASLEGSSNPENRMLVDCLIESYGAVTGLSFHAFSITYDMTQYHAFSEISPQTAGAIIEVGFMLTDRALLTQQPDLAAEGIADGIYCFLQERRQHQG